MNETLFTNIYTRTIINCVHNYLKINTSQILFKRENKTCTKPRPSITYWCKHCSIKPVQTWTIVLKWWCRPTTYPNAVYPLDDFVPLVQHFLLILRTSLVLPRLHCCLHVKHVALQRILGPDAVLLFVISSLYFSASRTTFSMFSLLRRPQAQRAMILITWKPLTQQHLLCVLFARQPIPLSTAF